MKTAIIYDRVNKFGGAERVLLALRELFPDAWLYTSVYCPKKAAWSKVFPKIIPSFLNKISFLRDRHQYLASLVPIAFESFNFDKFDLVISVTSEAAKGIITKPGTLHVCYCLTPTRYLWSGYNEYLKGATLQGITKPVVSYLRKWDRIAAQRPDVMLAISTEVRDRIKKYYGRKSEIIYPPVDVKKSDLCSMRFGLGDEKPICQLPSTNYYLIVSRLEAYKKVDLAIEAFIKMNKTLVVVGTGSMESKYKSKFKKYKNIIFTGFVNDDEVASLMHKAKGFIFPQEEDFGITSVEAQAAGCPVIAYKKGGALDTIIDRKTGMYFFEQNVESLIAGIKRFEKMKFDRKVLQKNAERFDKERFKKEIMQLINSYRQPS